MTQSGSQGSRSEGSDPGGAGRRDAETTSQLPVSSHSTAPPQRSDLGSLSCKQQDEGAVSVVRRVKGSGRARGDGGEAGRSGRGVSGGGQADAVGDGHRGWTSPRRAPL
jgi:hypothetical protein